MDDPVGATDPYGLEDRSIWDRFWAGYSPLLFGNEKEKKEARERLHRSLKKEAEALAGGYVDVNTILPAWLPTTIGIGILENFTPLPKPSEKIRQGYQGQKKR